MNRQLQLLLLSLAIVLPGCGQVDEAKGPDAGQVVDAGIVAKGSSRTCVHRCKVGQMSCAQGQPWSCGDADKDGCLEWVSEKACGEGWTCHGGRCHAIPCGEGTVLQDGKCVALKCGKGLVPQFGSCVPFPCGVGTRRSDGKCRPYCQHQCETGASRCLEGVPALCGQVAGKGCRVWLDGAKCTSKVFCHLGQCMPRSIGKTTGLTTGGQLRYLVVAAAPSDGNVVYAGGEHGGVRVSSDGGKTWKDANSGLWPVGNYAIAAIAVDPSNADRAFVFAGRHPGSGGIFRTDDRGGRWRELIRDTCASAHGSNRTVGRLIAINAADTDELYVANGACGLLKSNDGGENWSKIPGFTGKWLTGTAYANAAGTILYVIARTHPSTKALGGLWRWNKTGWHELSSEPFETLLPHDDSLYLGTPDGLYRWNQSAAQADLLLANAGCPKPASDWKNKTPRPRVISLAGHGKTLWMATRQHPSWGKCKSPIQLSGVFVSDDKGATFVSSTSVEPSSPWVNSWHEPGKGGFEPHTMAVGPDGKTIFVTSVGGIWRGTVGGTQWKPHFEGLGGFATTDLSVFRDSAGKDMVVTGVQGRDSAIWDDLLKAPTIIKLTIAKPDDRKHAATARLVLPQPRLAPKRFLAVLSANYYTQHKPGHGLLLSRTSFGGGDWEVLWRPGPYIHNIADDPANPDRLVAVLRPGKGLVSKSAAGGIWLSDDGGKTWARKVGGMKKLVESSSFLATNDRAELFRSDKIIYLGANRQGVWRSHDGGASFVEMPLAIHEAGKNKLTTVKANTCERVMLAVDGNKPKRIWLGINKYSGSWLNYSNDGGVNFEVRPGPFVGARAQRLVADRTGSRLIMQLYYHASLSYPGGGPGLWAYDTVAHSWTPAHIDGPEGQGFTTVQADPLVDRGFLAAVVFASPQRLQLP
jgi:photosystem II stability/assembly factor-like uncharacterized protein